MFRNPLYKRLLVDVVIIIALAVACRLTRGFSSAAVVAMGVWWAMQGRVGKACCCYVVLPFLVIFNNILIPMSLPFMASARFGVLLIGVALAIGAKRRVGRYVVPFASIGAYLLVASLSSATGYCPNVSYLKLVNFVVFIFGLYYGIRNMDRAYEDIKTLRAFLLAICCVTVFGSLMVLPFPAIAYSTSLGYLTMDMDAESAAAIAFADGMGNALFSGITMHSQTMAPLTAMIITYVLADMLFVEHKIDFFHGVLLVCAFVCVFLTRSRTGLLSTVMGVSLVCFYAAPRSRIPQSIKRRIKSLISGFVVLLIIVAAIGQVRNQTITKWLRKGDVAEDGKSLSEAVTSSRMGAVEELTYDFEQSPLWGKGFQVNAESARFRDAGFVLSAPVEKGLLPLVVLGECGVLGAITFVIFLVSFFSGCIRLRMYVTVATFATFLWTNIGEATFFSPGAVGGILWMFAIVGGVTLDSFVRAMQNLDMAQRLGMGYAYGGRW